MPSPSQQLMRLGLRFAVSQALRAVIELGVTDLMPAGKQSVDELAAATGSETRGPISIIEASAV